MISNGPKWPTDVPNQRAGMSWRHPTTHTDTHRHYYYKLLFFLRISCIINLFACRFNYSVCYNWNWSFYDLMSAPVLFSNCGVLDGNVLFYFFKFYSISCIIQGCLKIMFVCVCVRHGRVTSWAWVGAGGGVGGVTVRLVRLFSCYFPSPIFIVIVVHVCIHMVLWILMKLVISHNLYCITFFF